MRDVAPRLWRAHEAERAYQERRRREFQRGIVSMTVLMTEMNRAYAQLGTHVIESVQAFNAAMVKFTKKFAEAHRR